MEKRTPLWKTNWFRVALGTLVSAFFLYLALLDVPLGGVAEALARANYVWVVIAMGLIVLQTWLRALRWTLLFYPLNQGLRVRRMWGISLISQMLNIVSPWRIGELARIYLAGEIEKRSKAQVLATLGTEKLFDTLMLLVTLLGIPLFMTLPSGLEKSRDGVVVVSVGLVAAAVVLTFSRGWLISLLRRLRISWRGQTLDAHAEAALSSLDVFRRWDIHIELQALSLVIWSLGVLTNYLILLALGLQLAPIAPFVLLAFLQVGGLVPSSPGKMGVFQYLCILALSLFAVDKSVGLTYGILLYLVAYGIPMVLGLASLWWQGIHLQALMSRSTRAEGLQ